MTPCGAVSLFALIPLAALTVLAAPRVTITTGILEGSVLKSRKGRDIFAFRGIPYAKPPVGALRFQPPEPPESWLGVRPATHDGDPCLQVASPSRLTTIGSEDCLYINVYTSLSPERVLRNGTDRHAVMVWFHGGSWTKGSSNSSLYSPAYLLDHDIILVTMNYRLGALGFLSTADNVIPGNYALKDHVLALQWVQQNIAEFGGDPGKVTIMGESSGAFSVHYLMLSQLAEGLFHRAIAQSGIAIGSIEFYTVEAARRNARQLGESLDCPIDTSEGLLQCLHTKDPRDIVVKPVQWPSLQYALIPFRPVVESNHSGAFLTDDPHTLLIRRQSSLVPWMVGSVLNDGSIVANLFYPGSNQTNAEVLDRDFREIIPFIFGYATDCSRTSRDSISGHIRRYYFGDRRIDESTTMNVVNMGTDGLYRFPMATAVRDLLHAGSSIYLYSFEYNGDVKTESIRKFPELDFGVGHGEDLFYLFPIHELILPNSVMSSRDIQMVEVMTTLWTNFARFGKPVRRSTSQIPVVWEPVSSNALETYRIENPSSLGMTRNTYKNMLKLWSGFPCRAGLSAFNQNRRLCNRNR